MNVPTAADMASAKLLYVKLKMNYDAVPMMKSVDDLKAVLGDGGATAPWAALSGLRHKYFIYNEETQTCSGVYVFFRQEDMDSYLASELFAAQGTYPHVSEVTYEVKDVMPGTELAIEKTSWANTPPTREDVSRAVMLIVDLTMNYATGIEGLPSKADELYHFMSQAGMAYPAQFGGLDGLRGKYFCYDHGIDHCYGFYTFVDRVSLDKYMASDLFKAQADGPHIAAISYTVHEVLPGTERSVDLGEWAG